MVSPLVSVLILSMNHERFIQQCIHSISEQTYKNIEIVYLDNASSDHTFILGLKLLKETGLPFKAFKNEVSNGISKNLNFLLSHAQGEYISPLSADDWFSKENIQKKVEFMSQNDDVGAAFSNGWIYDDEKGVSTLNDDRPFLRGNIFKEILNKPDCIFYVGVLYRKDVLIKLKGWDENLMVEDVDLYIRLCLISKIDFIKNPLVYYRRTKESMSKNINYMIEGKNQYYHKYKNVKWMNMKQWLGEQYRRTAASLIDNSNVAKSFKFLYRSIELNPFNMTNYRTLLYLIRKAI